MDRISTIEKKLEDYDAGKVVLMPPHNDIVFLIRTVKTLREDISCLRALVRGLVAKAKETERC